MAKALGRGLESLIPPKNKREKIFSRQNAFFQKTTSSNAEKDSIFLLEIEKIKPNPYQPRKEFEREALESLASSIKEYGILQPLVVTKSEIEFSHGTRVEYHLIAGERRLRAAKIAGLSVIPAIIRKSNPKEKLELALIENIQREDLNVIERARAYKKLMDEFGFTQKLVSDRVGKSREVIANAIRILNLPEKIQHGIVNNKISEGHARIILSIPEVDGRIALFDKILKDNLSVRDTESISRILKAAPKKKKTILIDPETRSLQEKIEEALGTRVVFNRKGSSGKIIIEFYSEDDLNNVLNKILSN